MKTQTVSPLNSSSSEESASKSGTTRHALHDLDNPGVQWFERWHALLVRVAEQQITGYAVDSEREVVRFRKGKRKGLDGKWHPAV